MIMVLTLCTLDLLTESPSVDHKIEVLQNRQQVCCKKAVWHGQSKMLHLHAGSKVLIEGRQAAVAGCRSAGSVVGYHISAHYTPNHSSVEGQTENRDLNDHNLQLAADHNSSKVSRGKCRVRWLRSHALSIVIIATRGLSRSSRPLIPTSTKIYGRMLLRVVAAIRLLRILSCLRRIGTSSSIIISSVWLNLRLTWRWSTRSPLWWSCKTTRTIALGS